MTVSWSVLNGFFIIIVLMLCGCWVKIWFCGLSIICVGLLMKLSKFKVAEVCEINSYYTIEISEIIWIDVDCRPVYCVFFVYCYIFSRFGGLYLKALDEIPFWLKEHSILRWFLPDPILEVFKEGAIVVTFEAAVVNSLMFYNVLLGLISFEGVLK